MTTVQRYSNPWVPVSIAVVTSGLLYYFSIGLTGIGALAFFAPLPVLAVSYRLSFRKALLASFLAYSLGMLNLANYLLIFAPPVVVIFYMILFALAFSLAVAISRSATLVLKPWLAVFVFPSVSTTLEFINSLWSPNGTGGSLAYTQSHFLPLIQIASLTGIWGVTFITTLVPSTLAVLWLVKGSRKEVMKTVAVPLTTVAAVLMFGWARLAEPRVEKPVLVGLAASDTTIRYFRTTSPEKPLEVMRQYAGRVTDLSRFGARVVVLPEKFAAVTSLTDAVAYSIFRQTAREDSIVIVAGFNYIASSLDTNVAAVFFPDGSVLNYDKCHLVPGFESRYFAGNKPLVFPFIHSIAGVEICKDMDFPSWSRQYGRRGVGLLFVPAWDFTVDDEFHMRMALLRGVENGFSIVRCAQQGLLTVSDYRGEIIAEESTSSSGEVLLLSSVSPGPERTFYSITGDWFGWLNAALTAVFISVVVLKRRRKSLAG